MCELTVIEISDTLTHVAISGRLEVAGGEAVELKLTDQTASRPQATILDISGLEFISSHGMGMLVRLAKSIKSNGVPVILLGATGVVKRSLPASSIDKIVPMAPNLIRAREIMHTE